MTGKYLDEWNIDDVFITPSRTITETDVVMFASMTGDFNQIHTSKKYMEKSIFGERIAHGLLGLSLSHGLFSRLGLIEETAIAFLGIESWDFLAPIYFNDTVHIKIIVKDIINSKSKKDRGILKLKFEIINQNEVVCQKGIKKIMMKRN